MKRTSQFPAMVSYFLITVLASIALKSGIDSIKDMITKDGLALTILWAIPIAFVITLLRFFFGNLAMMINIEKMTNEKKIISESFWFFNMFFIFIEMFFFSLMGGFICEMQHYFIHLVLIVLLIDEFWFLGSSILFREKLFFKTFMSIWSLINLVTIVVVFGIVSYFGLSNITFLLVSTILILSAILDFLLTLRHYIANGALSQNEHN